MYRPKIWLQERAPKATFYSDAREKVHIIRAVVYCTSAMTILNLVQLANYLFNLFGVFLPQTQSEDFTHFPLADSGPPEW